MKPGDIKPGDIVKGISSNNLYHVTDINSIEFTLRPFNNDAVYHTCSWELYTKAYPTSTSSEEVINDLKNRESALQAELDKIAETRKALEELYK